MLIGFTFFWITNSFSQTPIVKNLSQWKYFSTYKNKWISVTVPGSVQSDLLEHEIIFNPLRGPNPEELEKISNLSHNYQASFNCTQQELLMETAMLDFQGIDTYAEVLLNGERILSADNMFREWKVNVKPLLKEKNVLNVHFLNIDSVEAAKMKLLPYQLPEGARVFTRKAQYQYGWDFAAKLKTVGLWKPVYLSLSNSAFITDVFVNTLSCT